MNATHDPTAAADLARLRRRRRTRRATSVVAAVAGLVAVVAGTHLAWDYFGTGLATARAQTQMQAQMAAGIDQQVAAAAAPTGGGDVALVEQSTIEMPTVQGDQVEPSVPEGTPWAMVEVVDADGRTLIGPYAVIQGVSDQHLAKGPGHYPGTPDPGEDGNVGIAGHRVTYGHPFRDMGEVGDGATIKVTDRDGVTHRYRYHSTRIVSPDTVEVLDVDPTGTGQPTLTLTTCHPKFSNRERMVVHATLVS